VDAEVARSEATGVGGSSGAHTRRTHDILFDFKGLRACGTGWHRELALRVVAGAADQGLVAGGHGVGFGPAVAGGGAGGLGG
jgi:hypothetical protein